MTTENPACRRCGAHLPAGETANYCCVGCALLRQIPVDAKGNFPVNRALIAMLVGGILFFNQILFWAGAEWQLAHDRVRVAERLMWAHFVAAMAVWAWQAVVAVWQRSAAPRKSWLFGGLTLGILLSTLRHSPPAGGILVAVNAVFIFWNFRGATRKAR